MTKVEAIIQGLWAKRGIALLVFAPLVALVAGCGGGGPISNQQNQPNVPGNAANLQALLPPGQQGATNVGSRKCGECHGTLPKTSLALNSSPSDSPKLQRVASRAKSVAARRTLRSAVKRQGALRDLFAPFSQTLHVAKGVECESCHGPGSAHVEAGGDKNKILTYPNITDPVVCGQCHAGIHQEWQTSQHFHIVGAVVNNARANPGTYVRTCFRCHSGLFRTQIVEEGVLMGDPNRNPNTMSVDQLQAFIDPTVHTAMCATCHDPHRQTGNLSDDNKEVQLRQPVFQTDTTKIAPGATVDNYTTFNHICAKCHNGRGANPSDAALGLVNGQLTTTGTSRPNMHDSNQFNMLAGFGGVDMGGAIASDAHFSIRGQCSSCHMFNGAGRHTFTVKLDNCQPCHSIADAAARRNAIQSTVINELLALRSRLESWAQATFGDPALWDYTALIAEEGKTAPPQAQVPIQIRRARHNYYFVVRDASLGVHNGKYARFLIDVANEQLDELNVPLQRVLPNVKQGRAILQSDRLRATRADFHEGQ